MILFLCVWPEKKRNFTCETSHFNYNSFPSKQKHRQLIILLVFRSAVLMTHPSQTCSLHPLRSGGVVHACGHDGEEHAGEEGAEVDGHLGQRGSDEHLLRLIIQRLHDLSHGFVWRNATRPLREQPCSTASTDTISHQNQPVLKLTDESLIVCFSVRN